MRCIVVILLLLYPCAMGGRGIFERDAPASHRIPELPAALNFAGEEVPLQYFDVRESMEREIAVNAFWHSQTLMLIRLANRYFPIIEPILRERNIPSDFKYLCVAESGLQHVVSPAKAAGLWQFIPSTAKEFGLEVGDEVDERYNIELATRAACAFLQKAYDLYGSWAMAAAAYNMGTTGLTAQVAAQKTSIYYDLRLNRETSRYLFRILALKLILTNPAKYGFDVPKEQLYPPFRYKEVMVNMPVASWADFAAQYGTNYKMLKLLNPWLREPFLTNKNQKTYYIKIMDADFRENAYR